MDEKFLNQIQEKENAELTDKCELKKEELKREFMEEKEKMLDRRNLANQKDQPQTEENEQLQRDYCNMNEAMEHLLKEVSDLQIVKEKMEREISDMEVQKQQLRRDFNTVKENQEQQIQREAEEQIKNELNAVEETKEQIRREVKAMVEQRDLFRAELKEERDTFLDEFEVTKGKCKREMEGQINQLKREISKEEEQKRHLIKELSELKDLKGQMEKDIAEKERQKDQLEIECSILEEKREQDVEERLQSDAKQDMFHLPQNQASHQTITSQTEQATFTSNISPVVTSKSGNRQFNNAFDFYVSCSVSLMIPSLTYL